jgi:hypothetical protein
MMKEPNRNKLRLDAVETRRIRELGSKSKSIKITINVDAATLTALKTEATASGVPYQRLLNKLLRNAVTGRESTEQRIDRLERELNKIKKKLAA